MLAILLALGAALGYGGSDFVAGWLSRKSHYARVGLLSQLTAAAGCVAVAALVGGTSSSVALGWGAFAGLGGGFGTLALYRGLGRGRMNVVAPLSGVLAAGLPALVGLALGERPSAAAMVGLVLALPAVWLTSSIDAAVDSSDPATTRASVVDGILAGIGFAVLFVGLQRGGRGGGLWPSAASQVVSALPMLGLYAWKRASGGRSALGAGSTAVVRLGPIPVASSPRWRSPSITWRHSEASSPWWRCSPRCTRRSRWLSPAGCSRSGSAGVRAPGWRWRGSRWRSSPRPERLSLEPSKQ